LNQAVNDEALDLLFRSARTFRKFGPEPVTPQILMVVYDLMRLGPTASNCCPARILFVVSEAAKAKLKPHLAKGNVDQTMNAPATAILGYDLAYYEKFPILSPDRPGARDHAASKGPDINHEIAYRSGTLQGGYFIMAARAVGLDCGPMSGFDNAGVDEAFFAGTQIKSNFLCNLGYGDEPSMSLRAPRLSFDDACKIL
jgi:3-hydroxypropanoate dehydrogenase